MPSKYRPQLFGWIDDLDKGARYNTYTDDRLIYANDNYCAFIRKTLANQLFYLALSIIVIIGFIVLAIVASEFYIFTVTDPDPDPDPSIFIAITIGMVALCVGMYASFLAEFYQNILPTRGSPIIFNRKTNKVYINESYFFNFKFWRNPLMFLLPLKRRIKEYDWADLHGVFIHNYSRNALVSTILMVCKPGTYKTIDHIMLEPAQQGIGSLAVWAWVNGFMVNHRSANIEDGKYLSSQEELFKQHYIQGQHWPQWMLEAFNANSLDELGQIKQKYGIKE